MTSIDKTPHALSSTPLGDDDAEYRRALRENQLEQWRVERENEQIGFKGVLDFSAIAIRSLIIVNGGAILAMLTFMGNLRAGNSAANQLLAIALVPVFGWYLAGIVFALLTAMFAYLAQMVFVESGMTKENKLGMRLRFSGLVFGTLSVLNFVVGSVVAFRAFWQF